MQKTSFVCNSLTWKHFAMFCLHMLSFPKPDKSREKFRNKIAEVFRIRENEVFLFGAARMGLYSILKAMRYSPGEEVIVAGYTCVVVTNAIKYAGLNAVYADIGVDHLNISTQEILDRVTNRTKAVIITHNFGITYEDAEIIRKKFPHLLIIEDAAHTLSSVTREGKRAGLLGDAAFFSLEYSKPMTTGMGGFILVQNDKVRDKLEEFYNHDVFDYRPLDVFRIFITLKIHFLTSYRLTLKFKWGLFRIAGWMGLIFRTPEEELQGERPGKYPVRLAGCLSYLGYLQLKDLEQTTRIKREICMSYEGSFGKIPGVQTFYKPEYDFVRYPVVLPDGLSEGARQALRDKFRDAGYTMGEWFNDVVHPAGSYRYCYSDGVCPTGEAISKRILNLPVNIHAKLNNRDLTRIRQIFREISD